MIFLLILSGASTSTTGAALACRSWPLCTDSQLIPDRTSTYTWIHLGHRATALIGALAVALVAREVWRRRAPRAARQLALAAIGVMVVQILLGGAYVISAGSPWLSGAHLATATILWGVMAAIAVVVRQPDATEARSGLAGAPARRRAVAPATGQPATMQMTAASGSVAAALPLTRDVAVLRLPAPNLSRIRLVFADYLALTKPGILSLLLTTTLGAMLIAAEGIPSLGLIVATLLGGALAAGGANALNCFIDRDIDARMPRTRHRATVAGRISPGAALAFGVTLSVLAVIELGLLVNWLAAVLALSGNLYYVLVYTKWLKRITPHNIVIGGAAGAVPPLVGWAAVTGRLDLAAWVLFAVIFAWTPPHFWALALLKHGEYGRAAVPMLPVVAGEAETRRQIVLYSVLLLVVCLLLVPLGLGPLYLVAALALNGVFLGLALRLFVAPSKKLARHLFFFSLWYLAFIFAAAVADRLVLA